MSVTWGSPEYLTLLDFIARYLRPHDGATADPATNIVTFTFDPPLTAGEQTFLADLELLAKSKTGLSPTDYAAVRTQMQALRAVRQTTRNAYVNMTEADRNRMDYDALVACCEIFLKLFRDT